MDGRGRGGSPVGLYGSLAVPGAVLVVFTFAAFAAFAVFCVGHHLDNLDNKYGQLVQL